MKYTIRTTLAIAAACAALYAVKPSEAVDVQYVTETHMGVTMDEFCRYQMLMVQLGGKWVHNGCPFYLKMERKPE